MKSLRLRDVNDSPKITKSVKGRGKFQSLVCLTPIPGLLLCHCGAPGDRHPGMALSLTHCSHYIQNRHCLLGSVFVNEWMNGLDWRISEPSSCSFLLLQLGLDQGHQRQILGHKQGVLPIGGFFWIQSHGKPDTQGTFIWHPPLSKTL